MRVIVTVKQILDPGGITVNRRRERIFVNREEYIINPIDKLALEAALRLKDAHGAEVVAISLGPARADDALREALAMGADSAYLLSDDLLAETDGSGAAQSLARAIEKIGAYDLVLAGQMSDDTSGQEIGGRLAELLSLPQILEAKELRLTDGNALEVVREWNGGQVIVRTGMPALVAISPRAPAARHAHGARIMNAYREWSVTTWTASVLGLTEEDLTPLTESRGLSFPAERERGSVLSGSPADMAADVVAQWRDRRLV
jgi:electron transfer flavoprotein alpha/beta subunit